jgi:Class II Aldolase and Adducin N-terminal domain
MKDEGYIKFNCIRYEEVLAELPEMIEINKIRTQLWDLGLIGVLPNGIGFGNISIRLSDNKFLISGTRTGQLRQLESKNFSIVEKYSITDNKVICRGECKASSESMTHAALYESDTNIKSVIHIHSKELWERLKFKVVTIDEKYKYGTPMLAIELQNEYIRNFDSPHGIIVLAGHEDGVFAFSDQLENAARLLTKKIK